MDTQGFPPEVTLVSSVTKISKKPGAKGVLSVGDFVSDTCTVFAVSMPQFPVQPGVFWTNETVVACPTVGMANRPYSGNRFWRCIWPKQVACYFQRTVSGVCQ